MVSRFWLYESWGDLAAYGHPVWREGPWFSSCFVLPIATIVSQVTA